MVLPGARHRALPLIRLATPLDAERLSLLASHVFLDTYVPQGVNRAIASEVQQRFAVPVLAARLQDPGVRVLVAETEGWLEGFADLTLQATGPSASAGPTLQGAELFRLYVHPRRQCQGLGARLLKAAEDLARGQGAACSWLSAWEGNARALAFYARQGYQDVGETDYRIDGVSYRNRVFHKALHAWTTSTTS